MPVRVYTVCKNNARRASSTILPFVFKEATL